MAICTVFLDGGTRDCYAASFPSVDGQLGLVNSAHLHWLLICISNILLNMVVPLCVVASAGQTLEPLA